MRPVHRHLPANPVGRDFVVGDLHGCLDLLERELELVRFDRRRDRLFSVGDLIDRGPDSLGCLRLLREPWFYAVIGNHEDMLLSFYGRRKLGYSSSYDFLLNGGEWVRHLDYEQQSELRTDLVPRVLDLPYVMTVDQGGERFHLAHAELVQGPIHQGSWLAPWGLNRDRELQRVLTDDLVSEATLEGMAVPLTWGRRLVGRLKAGAEVDSPIGKMFMSRQAWHPGLSLTFVGHTPLVQPAMRLSHFFIDRGAYRRTPDTRLLVVDTQKVREWLSSDKSIYR